MMRLYLTKQYYEPEPEKWAADKIIYIEEIDITIGFKKKNINADNRTPQLKNVIW
jgi:hypothetical protein